jgi:flagellar hook-associated protein 2
MAGTISSAGVGSGLDVAGIIDKLMAVERQPMAKLQTQASVMQTQLSAFGQMQSLVAAFKDATTALLSADNYALTSATSGDSTIVGASSTAKAAPGSYAVSVSALASAQTVASTAGQFAAATNLVGTGSITIRLGAWNAGQTAFTEKPDSSDVVIPIGAEANTLEGIRDAINAAGAGVTASIVTDTTGARLALQSASTGAENGFRVTVADDDGNDADALGLSRLAFDPPGGANQMTLTASAANTQATINGIAVTSTDAKISAIDGLTLTANRVTASPVAVSVTRNTGALKGLINGFASAYNALNTFIGETTKYDTENKRASLLQGDRTALGLQSQMRAILGGAGAGSATFTTLSQIGLEFQRDGSLKVNDGKLDAAMGNLPELKSALASADTAQPSKYGFAKKIAVWADAMLGTDGALPSRTQSIQKRISANQKDQERFEQRLAQVEARLRKQYSALDSTMANANALSRYVTQQITTWNNVKTQA